MKKKYYALPVAMMLMAIGAKAQVQVDKPVQLTGSSASDRRVTGLGSTIQDTSDAVSAANVQSGVLSYAPASGSGNNYQVSLPVSVGYTAGMMVSFRSNAANSGAVTLNVNGLGTRSVLKNVVQSLQPNDISAGQIISVMYDGNNFQVISQLAQVTNFTGTLSGDVTGTQGATVIAPGAVTGSKIANNAVTTGNIANGAVTDAQVAYGISYAKLSGAPTALPPTGAAGGDLVGNYPNPTVGAQVISTTKIADSAINSAKIISNSIQTNHLANGSVTDGKIVSMSYGKLTGAPTTFPPSGNAGGDLIGTYPNPTIASTPATGADVISALNSATSSTINVARLAPTVTNQGNTFNGNSQLVQTTATGKLPVIDGSNLTNLPSTAPNGPAGGDLTGTYPNPTLALSGVTAGTYGSATTTAAITLDNKGRVISATSQTITGTTPGGAAGGDLTGTYPNPTVTTQAITTAKIADSAVTSIKIVSGTIQTNHIVDGNVTDAKIASVSYSKVTGAPATLPPSGTAGGDLGGTYPNPTIAATAGTDVVNAINASSSTVNIGRLPATVTNQGNTFNGNTQLVQTTATGKLPVIDGSNLTNLNASNIASGTLNAAQLPATATTQGNTFNGNSQLVQLSATGKLPAVDGSQLTNLPPTAPTGAAGGDLGGTYPNPTIAATAGADVVNAINASTSTVNIGRLPATVTNQGNTFNGNTQLVQTTATGKLPVIDGSNLTNLNASNIVSGTLNAAQLPAIATAQGNTFNGNSQLVQLSATGKLPAVDGSQLTNLPATAPTGAAGGDLSGTYPNPTIGASAVTPSKISSAGATNGQVLSYNGVGVAWVTPNNTPGGSAGGDLTGSYPSPVIANGVVTPAKLNATGAVSGQFIGYNGTTIAWATPSNVPGGAAGGDLTGTYPNPTLATSGVTAATYGSATQVPQYTVDGKGRITSASNVTITGTTPGGAAGGDLAGTYPNPTIAATAAAGADVVSAVNASSATINAARLQNTVTTQGNTFNGNSQLVQTSATGKLPAIDGSQLTNLNATNISSGTLAAAQLPATATTQGNTFNGNSQLVQLGATGKLPAVDGSQLTNLPAGAPSGTASGDLAGSYPSPTLSTSAATGANVVSAINASSSTINAARLAATVTTQGNTFNGNSQLVQLGATGKLPAVDGSQLTNLPVSNLTGDVTSVGTTTSYNNVVPANKGGAGAVTGLLKADGSGTVSAATAGTDYLTPTGSAASLTGFPTLNQNTTGNAATVTTNANMTGDVTSTGNTTTYNNVVPATKGGAGAVTGLLKANGSGTVSAATSGTDYEVPLTFSTGLTRSTNTVTVNTTQNISTLSNLISNGVVTTSGGTGALGITGTTGSGSVVLATSPTLVTPNLGTIQSGNGAALTNITAANITGTNTLPAGVLPTTVTTQGNTFNGNSQLIQATATGKYPALDGSLITGIVSSAGNLTGDITSTGLATSYNNIVPTNKGGAGAINGLLSANGAGTVSAASTTGSGSVVLATSPTLVTPALGTPSALVGTNISGTAANLTAGNVTTNANLTGDVTSTGNATTIANNATSGNNIATALNSATSKTGSGSVVLATSPTLVTPALGTPQSGNASNLTNIPVNQATGNLPVANLGSGTGASATTFWRGDGTWATPSGGGGGLSAGTAAGQVYLTGTAGAAPTTPVTVSGDISITSAGVTSYNNVVPTNKGGAGAINGLLSANGAGTVSAASTTGSGSVVLSASPTLVTPSLGTPSALVGTNISGTAANLTAGNVTTNAAMTGDVTSSGSTNATTIATSGATGIAAGNHIVTAINLGTGVINPANLGSSSGTATKFLNGAGVFTTPSGGSNGTTQNGSTYTIANTDNFIMTNGGNTFTLPTSAGATAGHIVYIYAVNSAFTINRAGTTDVIYDSNGASQTSLTGIFRVILISDGAGHWAQMQ